ncbi:hypothetical protein BCT04_16140 [Vibrio breoganii]|uniref:hypothetical protein n=1 Tax=Vibrio breoganii TaxID=553239 RepID=UPI000C85B6E8|nr:hypothetical protein [Vibrio breoganii]PMO63058.1 hypothetical protein BCT04_16140 [Vibrio breoganii]
MNNFMSRFLLFLIVFDLAIPPVKFLGSSIFALALLMAEYIFNPQRFKYIAHSIDYFKIPFLILYIIVLYSIFRVGIIEFTQFQFIGSLFKTVIILLTIVMYTGRYEKEKIINNVFYIFILNSLICFLAGTFPELLKIVYIFKPDVTLTTWITYRNAFLSGSGFFGIATAYSFALIALAIQNKKRKISVSFLLQILILMIAGIIAARTTFIGILVAWSIFTYYNTKQSIIITSSVAVFILIVVFSGIFEGIEAYTNWAFEMFINLFNSGSLSTSSTDHLGRMYFLPSSEWSFIVGDGLYTTNDGKYYMNTDAGYMRHLYFGGTPFLVLLFSFVFSFLLKSRNRNIVFLLLVVSLIFHIKGGFLLHNRVGFPLLLILCYYYGSRKNEIVKKSISHPTSI